MKKILSLLLVCLSLTIASAQTATETKTAKKDAKATKVERNPDGTFKKADQTAQKTDKPERNPDGTFKSKADKAAMKDDKKMADKMAKPDKVEKEVKAVPEDYKAAIDKSQKGPAGETVYTGPRGGKYYITKAGNKRYLSSSK
ncbi:hypothetical protein GCM10027299_41800 [Larkinella ripae]